MQNDSPQKQEQQLYDITHVCQMLGTTSRTLRFYQERGIIQSTVTPFSGRRQYTTEQIDKIRNVLALRALGLSIKTIGELQKEDTDLKTALLLRKAQIIATIQSKQQEIHTLNEALRTLSVNQTLCSGQAFPTSTPPTEEALKKIARICAEAVLQGNTEILYDHLTPQLMAYMPREAYECIREDMLAPLGKLIALKEIVNDSLYPYVFYAFAIYEHLKLCIKMVFCHNLIEGLWLTYDPLERSEP